MKIVVVIFSVLFGAYLHGAEEPRTLYPLTVNEGFPSEYQKAALEVVFAVSKEGLKPREYSAEVTPGTAGRSLSSPCGTPLH